MTGTASPEPADRMPDGRLDNGLDAPSYVPLTDLDDATGRSVLTKLGRARIAAYLTDIGDGRVRLHVAADDRGDARTIVAAALRAEGTELPDPTHPVQDPLAGLDTEAAFAELVSDWHVDTIAAVREAERQLRREDADWRAKLTPAAEPDEPVWLDEEHYIPPPPPPLPRLAAPTVGAMSLLAISIMLLGIGGEFGLAAGLTMLLGVMGVLVAGYLLVMRLRERRDDDDDDGAVL